MNDKIKLAIESLEHSTPEPWEVDGRLINSESERNDGWRIVCILHEEVKPETANLIAAAPDMAKYIKENDLEFSVTEFLMKKNNELESENAKLYKQLRELEWALAETEALVLSHEGHIDKLNNKIITLAADNAQLQIWRKKAVASIILAAGKLKACNDEYDDDYLNLTTLIKEANE